MKSPRRQQGQRDRGGSLREKFENRVKKSDGCWVWWGNVNAETGYGRLFFEGRIHFAHRVSYELHKGPIASGIFVCHKCDNPPCCNPDHLFLGTQADNMTDKSRKGRSRGGVFKGSAHHNSSLNDDQVIEIRGLLKLPHFHGKYAQMGRAFGVDECAIHHIKAGRSWRHL